MCKKVRGYVGMYVDLHDADDRLAFAEALKELAEAVERIFSNHGLSPTRIYRDHKEVRRRSPR